MKTGPDAKGLNVTLKKLIVFIMKSHKRCTIALNKF